MNKERLLKLAEFLDAVPKEQFNLGQWTSDGSVGSCGTTACACGWATTIPEFREAGLRLEKQSDYFGESFHALVYEQLKNWDAVELFFGISFDDACRLFYEGAYPDEDVNNPRAVADRIRDFVKTADAAEVTS